MEEERRLAYVAVTQARRDLLITHAARRTLYGQTQVNDPSTSCATSRPAPATAAVGSKTRSAPRQVLNRL